MEYKFKYEHDALIQQIVLDLMIVKKGRPYLRSIKEITTMLDEKYGPQMSPYDLEKMVEYHYQSWVNFFAYGPKDPE